MESCDVLVVGGGPAGSSCAWELRNHGLDVVVMDAKTFPRDKVCAGWITPAVLTALEIAPQDYAAERLLQPITSFQTGMIGGPTAHARYDRIVSYGIRRREFDDFLLRRSGARRLLGEKLHSLEREGAGWVANGRISTPLIVGAGGHFCPVAKRLGTTERRLAVVAQEIELRLDPEQGALCMVRGETPELYFCRDMVGYGWALRKGDYLNVGLGREDATRLSEHLRAFVRFLVERGRIPDGLLHGFVGHAYQLYGHGDRRYLDDGLILVGDAAGLAYPESGEGIRPAVESGILAARAILAANGDYARQRLAPYQRRLLERLGPPRGGPIKALGPLGSALAGHLLASRWFARHLVLDRWFLHARQLALRA